ncbi:succinylglutamate desuccinylase/aspartoacylase family protein [Thalassolituus sp. LLYu03]|uniref:succinylglutamate desuccinylase/aspartoacylase family protein n=1 Tax=Thalassolituus sp. LLYu03 TaxID=3421656 RepID=UPI003D29C122
MSRNGLTIGGITVRPGETQKIELPAGRLYTDAALSIPVYVKRGKQDGPTLFLSAAIHGDELNGISIIQRLIHSPKLRSLRGTLIAVPVVNVYGVINHSRYLPDRRDLNRLFPGSKKGSLGGRIASLFIDEIVAKCDFGIDFHTGALHRSNLPQIRANLDDEKTLALARAFGVPVLLNSNVRDGSLRQAASDLGVTTLLYEAGEALRYDELSILAGERGTINVMRHLGMLPKSRSKKAAIEPVTARTSRWARATDSGFVQLHKELGDRVQANELLATIRDPYGNVLNEVRTAYEGIIIGKQNIPLVQEGEAMYHIAYFHQPSDVVEGIEQLQDLLPDDLTQ